MIGAGVGSLAAYTASLTVPATILMNKGHALTLSELVPSRCTGLSIATVHKWNASNAQGGNSAGSWSAIWGTFNNNSNTLWLWNEKNQSTGGGGANLNGGNGSDCMAPGGTRSGASLTVGGGKGTDQCYTGPGSGTYTANSCNNSPLWSTPYQSTTTNNPSFT
jgi:hypothetical protein